MGDTTAGQEVIADTAKGPVDTHATEEDVAIGVDAVTTKGGAVEVDIAKEIVGGVTVVQRVARIGVNDFEVGSPARDAALFAVKFDRAVAVEVETDNLVRRVREVNADVHVAGEAHGVGTSRSGRGELEHRNHRRNHHIGCANGLAVNHSARDLRVECRGGRAVDRVRGVVIGKAVQHVDDGLAAQGRGGAIKPRLHCGDCGSNTSAGNADVGHDQRCDIGGGHQTEVTNIKSIYQGIQAASGVGRREGLLGGGVANL